MRFESRADAGRRLAAALSAYAVRKPIVLALPRGGVPVAAVVAAALNVPLDLVLVRKIGTPGQPELALGAIVDGPSPMIVRNKRILASTGTSATTFDAICRRERAEIERRRILYLGKHEPVDIAGRVVIVVDDGIATGATMRAALRATRQRGPARLVLAVPVAAPDTLESLRPEVDEAICLTNPEGFLGVGQFYDDFHQVTDDEVVALMATGSGGSPPTRR